MPDKIIQQIYFGDTREYISTHLFDEIRIIKFLYYVRLIVFNHQLWLYEYVWVSPATLIFIFCKLTSHSNEKCSISTLLNEGVFFLIKLR